MTGFSPPIAARVAFLLAALLACPSARGGPPTGEAHSIDAIAKAWHKRQESVKTARIIWKQRKTTVGVKEELASFEFTSPKKAPSAAGPSADTKTTAPRRTASKLMHDSTLFLDGDAFAYTYDALGAAELNKAEFRAKIPSHFKVVQTATDYQRYSDLRSAPQALDRPSAVVTLKKQGKCRESEFPDVRPLMLALRPFAPQLDPVDLSQYRISLQQGVIGNVPCLILEPIGEPKRRLSYWVDPARDYIVMRAMTSVKGQLRSRLDIDYARDPLLGWVPSGWSWLALNIAGGLDESFHSDVREFTLNQAIGTAVFHVEQPDGAVVHDLRQGGDIVRWIGPHETSSGSEPGRRSWIAIAVNMLLAAALVYVAFARRYRRSDTG
jgi:hypothetical protein